jgi:hypothetical protein
VVEESLSEVGPVKLNHLRMSEFDVREVQPWSIGEIMAKTGFMKISRASELSAGEEREPRKPGPFEICPLGEPSQMEIGILGEPCSTKERISSEHPLTEGHFSIELCTHKHRVLAE